MRITYDPSKQAVTLQERGLDFADAATVFAGSTFEMEDNRRDYGETRMICFGYLAIWLFGYLADRMVVVGYTPRGAVRHVFSMRKANEREQERIRPQLDI